MASTESEVKAIVDRQAEAMRMKDLDRLMSLYSPDVVYFDVVPPLQYVGAAALRDRFHGWFESYQGPLEMDVCDVRVLAGADLAVIFWLSRVRGTLKSGRETGTWVRATSTTQRSNAGWLIAHEHVSLPVDMKTANAVMDLVP
jgi:uncharacterized protein (TIGR02246 family)